MVKQAQISDIPNLLRLGRLFHAQTPYGHQISFDADDMRETLINLISGGGVVFTNGHSLCGGVIVPFLTNHKVLVSAELFWFTEKGSGSEVRKAFEKWSADNGAQFIQMSCLVNDKEAAMRRLNRLNGYDAKEVSFLKAI